MKKHHITIMPSGYGHNEVTTDVYGKPFTFITSNTRATDDYRSEEGERDPRTKCIRRNQGYKELRKEAMNRYKASEMWRYIEFKTV